MIEPAWKLLTCPKCGGWTARRLSSHWACRERLVPIAEEQCLAAEAAYHVGGRPAVCRMFGFEL